MVAAEQGLVRAIVRPSIVESAIRYPFPGWNEGFTTTAPLIFIAFKGQTQIPADEKLVLDITPVDQVAAVMLAVAAEACVEEPRLVHQAGTGDTNPINMRRIVSLVGLYKRKHFEEKETGIRSVTRSPRAWRRHRHESFSRRPRREIHAAAKRASSLSIEVDRAGGGPHQRFG